MAAFSGRTIVRMCDRMHGNCGNGSAANDHKSFSAKWACFAVLSARRGSQRNQPNKKNIVANAVVLITDGDKRSCEFKN